MLSRVLFGAALVGSMLLSAVPARDAACQQDDGNKGKKKPCPRYERCISDIECKPLICGLSCRPDEDGRRDGRRNGTRVCR